MIEPVRVYTSLNALEYMRLKHIADCQRRSIASLLRWAVAQMIDSREWDPELTYELRRQFKEGYPVTDGTVLG